MNIRTELLLKEFIEAYKDLYENENVIETDKAITKLVDKHKLNQTDFETLIFDNRKYILENLDLDKMITDKVKSYKLEDNEDKEKFIEYTSHYEKPISKDKENDIIFTIAVEHYFGNFDGAYELEDFIGAALFDKVKFGEITNKEELISEITNDDQAVKSKRTFKP